MSCPICLEDYKGRSVVKVACQYCPFTACRGCLQRNLLQSYEDPHCLDCKRGWSSEFMAATFPLSFRNDVLRKHRRNILLEREKALLPAMQVFVGYRRDIEKYHAEIKQIRSVYGDPAIRVGSEEVENTVSWRYRVMANKYKELKARRDILREHIIQHKDNPAWTEKVYQMRKTRIEIKLTLESMQEPFRLLAEEYKNLGVALDTAIRNYWAANRLYTNAEEAPTQRREFIMKCSDTECRGFLTSAYKCGTCEKWTCSDCLVTIGADKEAEHTCDPNTVETAKAIKAETRPCPKCGTRIFKIDGCDQMYCVMEGCQTAFSWNSGQIVTGRIHNPHYYEWMKRTGGGIDREVGDIPCGGLPNMRQLFDALRYEQIPNNVRAMMYNAHRGLRELIDMRLYDFPARAPQLANKDLNVSYLTNKITEIEWKRQLEISEAKFQRKKEIGQILQTIATAGADVMNSIVNESHNMEEDVYAVWLSTAGAENLEQLRQFGNDSLKTLAKRDRIAVPQFGDSWEWKPLRAIYKPLPIPKLIEDPAAEPVAEVPA